MQTHAHPSSSADPTTPPQAEFDAFSKDYEKQLPFLKLAGESKDFYARARVEWVVRQLMKLNVPAPQTVLDFGCGTGSATPFLLDVLGATRVIGVDPSAASLDEARSAFASRPATFHMNNEYVPDGTVDLAFCNGVFHHIPPDERVAAARYVLDALKPGGLLALWENNPWNPLMLYGMRHTPLDANAIPVSKPVAHRLARDAGFERVRTDFLFIFPGPFRVLRPTEAWACKVPIGAQYLVLCLKPA
jgi:SAM-dependent methyltransferase